jgi:hypothetical protein
MNADKQLKRMEKAQRLIRKVDASVAKAKAEAELAKPPPDPYETWVTKAAAGGDPALRAERERLTEPDDDQQLREHATRVLKTAQSGEARRLAQVTLDRLDAEAQDRLTREALAKRGRPR